MKEIVKKKPEPGLYLEDVPVPAVGANDVLVKVQKTAICGTDVHIYNWDSWARETLPIPLVIGHEFVGVGETTGANVNDYQAEDLISGEGHVVCGQWRGH